MTGCGLCINIYMYRLNTWGAQTCSAGSNLAVYIVGALQLMQEIIMTKHKGFLHFAANIFTYIYI